MPLINILQRVSADNGLDITNAGVRAWLVDKVNEAAEEIYNYPDLPICLQEAFVRVTKNSEMSLPPFVGELRAVRYGCTDYCTPMWVLHTMWPKYNKVEWANKWYNWRIKEYSPIATDYTNTSPGTILYSEVDNDLVVTIQGETESSNNAVNNITISATTLPWISNFTQIKRISKNKVTNYNVVIKDADGNEMAIIYANQLESRYMVVDVSKYPQNLIGCCTCADGSYIMEVLFKPRLNRMSLDTDFFPIDGYENALILKTKQLLAELEDGKEQRALLLYQKTKEVISNASANKQDTFQKKITFKHNPFFLNFDYIPWDKQRGNRGSF